MLAELWLSASEIMSLPDAGEAWENVVAWSERSDPVNANDQDDDGDIVTLAKALVFVRTGDEDLRNQVVTRCMDLTQVQFTDMLGLARNLTPYVIAADLVGLPPAEQLSFSAWLGAIRYATVEGRTLISCHEDRPNNWGTHCGASRIASDLYLGDEADLEAAAAVFHGWLGNRDVYAGFEYGELCWQADPEEPVGINPVGAEVNGLDVDGVLPDDQRRSGQCPPDWSCENYVREALQGALAQAYMLHRHGYLDAWQAEDSALKRAAERLVSGGCGFPGDDEWEPWLLNWAYPELDLPAVEGARPGKGMGFTDWTHADVGGCDVIGMDELLAYLDNWQGTAGLLELLAAWGTCGGEASPASALCPPPQIQHCDHPDWPDWECVDFSWSVHPGQPGGLIAVDLEVSTDGPSGQGELLTWQAILEYSPQTVKLVGFEDPGVGYWMADFYADPDGINADIGDGLAMFTAMMCVSCGFEAPAPPAEPVAIARFLFEPVAPGPGNADVGILLEHGEWGQTNMLLPGAWRVLGDYCARARFTVGGAGSQEISRWPSSP